MLFMINKYLNLKNYLRYFLNRFVGLASIVLQPVENYLAKKYGYKGINKYPPVFIIGAPRSGSTLLYKALTEKFNLSYISNFTAILYKIPILATWSARKLAIKTSKGHYNFSYGNIKGMGSPSEYGEFWYRWFPKGQYVYVPPGQTSGKILQELRNEIGGTSYISKAPMIFKNLYNSMRIAPIIEAIPEACFIVCRRKLTENALSILQSRINNLNDKYKWWSLPPKEVDTLLKRNYAEQVVGQVYYIYKQIEADKKRFGETRFLEISYENFCHDVQGTLSKIVDFLSQNSCVIKNKGEVPNSFQTKKVEGMTREDRINIRSAINLFFKDTSDYI